MQAIQVKNLNKSFTKKIPQGMMSFNLLYAFLTNSEMVSFARVPIIKNLNLIVDAGKVIGIKGLNGSGKSTLLRILAGIYPYDSGEVLINGKILYFNGYSQLINKNLSALDNFLYVSAMYGLPQELIKEESLPSLLEVGLGEHINSKTYTLSDGQKSRLGFAISCMIIKSKNPDILILDEVFAGGGDSEFKKYSVQKIKAIIKGKTVLIVSHDQNLLEKECDMFYKMIDGQLEPVYFKYKNNSPSKPS